MSKLYVDVFEENANRPLPVRQEYEAGGDISPEDRAKLDAIQTDGDGDRFLADDGAYKEVQASVIDYSTEEQWTGKRWIDGRKVYQKTILLNPITAVFTNAYTPHGITGIDRCVDINCTSINDGGSVGSPVPRVWPQNKTYAGGAIVWCEATRIGLYGSDTYSYDFITTLEYVCTDR